MSDRPSTEIQNALTEQEWRTLKLWHAGKMIGGKVRGMVVGDLPESHQHGAAAFALYGKPYGFTYEDVATLRDTLALIGGWMPGPEPSHAEQVLASLKARISALLPPTP